VKSVTQIWSGAGAVKFLFRRSLARRPSLPGTVVRVLRPRTMPVHALVAHEPVHGVFGGLREAVTPQPLRHLSPPVDDLGPGATPRIRDFQGPECIGDACVFEGAQGRQAFPPRPVGSCGNLHALLPQDGTDRLDRTTNSAHFVDESTDQRRRGSSSLAKKIEACFRISLDSFKSRTSARSRLISSSSTLLGPVFSPPSTWA
jgi:hypothetical protein